MKRTNILEYIFTTHEKTLLIIESCKSLEQLVSATNWTNLLFDRWVDEVIKKTNTFNTLEGDIILSLMGKHQKKINLKTQELTRK